MGELTYLYFKSSNIIGKISKKVLNEIPIDQLQFDEALHEHFEYELMCQIDRIIEVLNGFQNPTIIEKTCRYHRGFSINLILKFKDIHDNPFTIEAIFDNEPNPSFTISIKRNNLKLNEYAVTLDKPRYFEYSQPILELNSNMLFDSFIVSEIESILKLVYTSTDNFDLFSKISSNDKIHTLSFSASDIYFNDIEWLGEITKTIKQFSSLNLEEKSILFNLHFLQIPRGLENKVPSPKDIIRKSTPLFYKLFLKAVELDSKLKEKRKNSVKQKLGAELYNKFYPE